MFEIWTNLTANLLLGYAPHRQVYRAAFAFAFGLLERQPPPPPQRLHYTRNGAGSIGGGGGVYYQR